VVALQTYGRRSVFVDDRLRWQMVVHGASKLHTTIGCYALAHLDHARIYGDVEGGPNC
jgi:hypothetical protein